MPSCFVDLLRSAAGSTIPCTYFQYFTGQDTLWPANAAITFKEIPDGLSRTILFAEAAT
jgi:hypothetical protein